MKETKPITNYTHVSKSGQVSICTVYKQTLLFDFHRLSAKKKMLSTLITTASYFKTTLMFPVYCYANTTCSCVQWIEAQLEEFATHLHCKWIVLQIITVQTNWDHKGGKAVCIAEQVWWVSGENSFMLKLRALWYFMFFIASCSRYWCCCTDCQQCSRQVSPCWL